MSHGGLTVRRNNPNSQRLNVIEVSHSCIISLWVLSRSLPYSHSGNPGSFHFAALPFSRASVSAAGFSASGWQMVEGRELGFMILASQRQTSGQLTSHWTELSHVITPNSRGAWEM